MRKFYGITLDTPLMLGTAQYPSPAIMAAAFGASNASAMIAGEGYCAVPSIRGVFSVTP